MVSSMALGALVGASLLAMAAAQSTSGSIVLIPTPTAKVPLKAMTTIGCFSTGVPLEPHGPWDFQTDGNCQGVCVGLEKGVMGLVNGTDCWCGDKLPPKDAEIDLEECNTPCPGFPQLNCGGGGTFLIINSGFNPNRLVNFDPSSSSSKSSSSSSTTSVEPVSTVVVSTTPSATPKKSNSPNKAGIAAGVVVGVLALAAIIGGVYFFLRQRRRRQVEEEYRRQAAVNSFVSGNKLHTSNSSMTDSRLDPEFMMRRQSNGSIADNEDYSRRILKVTNPDGH